MGFFDIILCIALTTLAASYGWGMRGAVIGGEKGAMLPGAFIAVILAWFSGGEIRENLPAVAAAGLMGMSFGGIDTYGETIGLVLHRNMPDYKPVKGYTGLAVKGALWFSLGGGFIAFSVSAMSGAIYSAADIVIFCLLIPLIQQIGFRIFNNPYNKEKSIRPMIYFSVKRREEWGSNFALVIAMLISAAIKGDYLMLTMISCGFVFGGIGWIVAMKAYEYSSFPMKNGKFLFTRLYRKGVFDGWKLMEFILGAFGGFGISLGFCIEHGVVAQHNKSILENGRFSPLGNSENVMIIVSALLVSCILAINIYQFICEKKNKKLNWFLLDQLERPLYNVIPMLFVLLGSSVVSRIMTVFMLVFVCVIKCVFDKFANERFIYVFQILSLAVCGVLFAGDIILGGYGPIVIMIAGTVPYLIAEFFCTVYDGRKKKLSLKNTFTKTAFATVYPCFALMSAVILIVSCKIFLF